MEQRVKIRKITYPTDLEKIPDLKNDNIDVFVETDEGRSYTFTVCTPEFYDWYMKKENLDFIPASPPDIIVSELKEDIIKRAIETFCEDNEYWLKLFFLAGNQSNMFLNTMNQMLNDMNS